MYNPLGKESKFTNHINLSKRGLNTFVNVPILIDERKFAGFLNVGSVKVDVLSPSDVALMEDVAATLGTYVYAKRLYASKSKSHKLSQTLLFSLLPPQVIEKIKHYWSSSPSEISPSSMTQILMGFNQFPKPLYCHNKQVLVPVNIPWFLTNSIWAIEYSAQLHHTRKQIANHLSERRFHGRLY